MANRTVRVLYTKIRSSRVNDLTLGEVEAVFDEAISIANEHIDMDESGSVIINLADLSRMVGVYKKWFKEQQEKFNCDSVTNKYNFLMTCLEANLTMAANNGNAHPVIAKLSLESDFNIKESGNQNGQGNSGALTIQVINTGAGVVESEEQIEKFKDPKYLDNESILLPEIE